MQRKIVYGAKGQKEENERGLRRHCIHQPEGPSIHIHLAAATTPQNRFPVGPSAGDSLVS